MIVIPVVNSGSCGEAEFEACQVAGSSAVQWRGGREGVQGEEVGGAGHVCVVEAGFRQAAVAGVAGAVAGGVVHGAFEGGAGGVVGLEGDACFGGAGGGGGLVDLARAQEQLPPGPGRGGALVPGGAVAAGRGGEPDADRVLAVAGAHRLPFAADRAFGAGGLLAVPVDGERLLGVAAAAGLGGVVGQQRPDPRDAVAGGLADQQSGAQVPRVEVVPSRGQGLSRQLLRSEEHTSELQSPDHLVCRLLLEKKKTTTASTRTL